MQLMAARDLRTEFLKPPIRGIAKPGSRREEATRGWNSDEEYGGGGGGERGGTTQADVKRMRRTANFVLLLT